MTTLNSQIGYDYKTGNFTVGKQDGNKVVASEYTVSDVDKLLAQIGLSNQVQDHELLAAQMLEPIQQVAPYVESFAPTFLQDVTYDYLDDNRIPVEDIATIAFETHQDGEVAFVKAGMYWTRPTFTGPYDFGLEIPHDALKRAGWNFVSRLMKRSMENITRKMDSAAKTAIEAVVPAANVFTVTGGSLTKTAVDTVLIAMTASAFPVKRILVNSSRIMDMAAFVYPVGNFLPAEEQRSLLRTLRLTEYGGAEIYANPFVPKNVVYFGGSPDQIGWRQVRGQWSTASDVQIAKRIDRHVVTSPEFAYYIGNTVSLATLTVTA